MPLMNVSLMHQSVGGSAMNFGGELPSFSPTKVSGFYFVFSICWLPFAFLFAGFLLLSSRCASLSSTIHYGSMRQVMLLSSAQCSDAHRRQAMDGR